jgi:peptide/nickel transport system permease protein
LPQINNLKLINYIFRKHLSLAIGVIIIGCATFIAIFSYPLTQFGAKNANVQLSDLGLAKPGTQINALRVYKNHPSKNSIKDIFQGKNLDFRIVPFISMESKNGYTHVVHPLPGEFPFLPGRTEIFSLPSLYCHLDPEVEPILENGVWSFNDSDGISYHMDTTKLKKAIFLNKDHVVSLHFPLGTDKYGRSIMDRVILGTRVSFSIGAFAVLISLFLGTLAGLLSGYYGGKIDIAIKFLMNIFWSIPTLLLVFAIVMALGRQNSNIYLAIGLTTWIEVARMVRAEVMTLKKQPFIEAANSLGLSNFRIIFRHILPNILGVILVLAASNFATAVMIESGLSFLGFGVNPPIPSWGNMLQENYGFAFSGHWLMALSPAFAIMICVMGFNLLATGLSDVLDIKRQENR